MWLLDECDWLCCAAGKQGNPPAYDELGKVGKKLFKTGFSQYICHFYIQVNNYAVVWAPVAVYFRLYSCKAVCLKSCIEVNLTFLKWWHVNWQHWEKYLALSIIFILYDYIVFFLFNVILDAFTMFTMFLTYLILQNNLSQ